MPLRGHSSRSLCAKVQWMPLGQRQGASAYHSACLSVAQGLRETKRTLGKRTWPFKAHEGEARCGCLTGAHSDCAPECFKIHTQHVQADERSFSAPGHARPVEGSCDAAAGAQIVLAVRKWQGAVIVSHI